MQLKVNGFCKYSEIIVNVNLMQKGCAFNMEMTVWLVVIS